MKTPKHNRHMIHRNSVTQREWLQRIVETHTFALHNEHQLPLLRAIWRVIDSKSGEENTGDRRKKP